MFLICLHCIEVSIWLFLFDQKLCHWAKINLLPLLFLKKIHISVYWNGIVKATYTILAPFQETFLGKKLTLMTISTVWLVDHGGLNQLHQDWWQTSNLNFSATTEINNQLSHWYSGFCHWKMLMMGFAVID